MPTPEFKEDFTSAHAQKAPRGSKGSVSIISVDTHPQVRWDPF